MRDELGHTEVGDFGETLTVGGDFGDHDVRGFDIAMDYAFAMGVVEGVRDLTEELQEGVEIGQIAVVQHALERGAGDILHEDVGVIFFFENVVDGDDVGVREQTGRLRFAKKAFADTLALLGVREFAEVDGLDGDGAADGRIERFVDDSGCSPTQFFEDLIAPNLIHDTSV